VEPLARVAADLQDAQLPVQFKLESASEGWQLFSITYDPAQVSAEQLRQILLDAGARVIPTPIGP
jgi:hypothetical protein